MWHVENMAHTSHTNNVQNSFLYELEQRQRLDTVLQEAASLVVQIRELKKAPESIARTDEASAVVGRIAAELQQFTEALAERRRAQLEIEFSFGGSK